MNNEQTKLVTLGDSGLGFAIAEKFIQISIRTIIKKSTCRIILHVITGFYMVLSGSFCKAQDHNSIGLAQMFSRHFKIGAALNASQASGTNPTTTAFITSQFNAITPENVMKAENIHPAWNQFDFKRADEIIDFGKKHHIEVNGHTLVWHSQLPAFARKIQQTDSFRTFFRNHISVVASRYKGRIQSWDVVNEALNEDGTLRESIFLEKLGQNYIADAFKLAEAASPGTELYYNDYNIEQPTKRAGCIALLKQIKQAGARIDGVGIQGHWQIGKVQFEEIEKSIIEYHSLGLKVMITELDIDVLPRNESGADISKSEKSSEQMNPYTNGIPDEVLAKQAEDYKKLFAIFLKHADKLTRVTFWGVDDGQSWLNGWPIPGRTNYPLIFDRNQNPKPSYHSIMELVRK
jgi:endo-1,4-beta-xylanase